MSRGPLLELLRFQARDCRAHGSDLYGRVCDAIVDDVEADGPCAAAFDQWTEHDGDVVPALRLLGGVHRLALDGRAPDLAAAYPSTGGSLDVDPIAPFLAAVEEHVDELRGRIREPVQTNEVGRSLALVGAFHEVARATGKPLRVLEFGASAGLNLRWDHFFYRAAEGCEWGDPESPVRFEGGFLDGCPSFVPDLEVVERRGVDQSPIDATTDDGRLRLLGFVWPDQLERFQRLAGAIEVARQVPATVDASHGLPWVEQQLAEPVPGVATVLFHSIVLLYLLPEERAELKDLVQAAGARATEDAPLARIGLEVMGEDPNLRLQLWPGGEPQVLGQCHPHGPPVRWLAG